MYLSYKAYQASREEVTTLYFMKKCKTPRKTVFYITQYDDSYT